MGVCSSHPADQRHCSSESCTLSPSAQGGASQLSLVSGEGPGQRPRGHQVSASPSPSAGHCSVSSPTNLPSFFFQGLSTFQILKRERGELRGSRRLASAAQRRDGREDPSQQVPCWAGYELGPATILTPCTRVTRATGLCPAGFRPLSQQKPGHPGPASQARPLCQTSAPGAPDPASGWGVREVRSIMNTQLQSPQKRAPSSWAPRRSPWRAGGEGTPPDLSFQVLKRQPVNLRDQEHLRAAGWAAWRALT